MDHLNRRTLDHGPAEGAGWGRGGDWCFWRRTRGGAGRAVLAALAVAVAGCSSAHYRKSADKETYRILQEVDARVFGRTNAFTIDTRYSGRDPKAIPPEEILGDRMATNRRVVNLDQALELALQNSREYQFQKETLYLAALDLTGARYQFSPKFIGSSTAQIAGSPNGADIGSVRNQLQVGQLLKTGGSLTMSLGNDLVRYFTGKPDMVARNSVLDTLSVDLTQPILQGFGINDPTVERLTQAERDVVYALRTFTLYQQQFAVNVVTAYFSLLTQKEAVRIGYRDFTNRVATTQYLEARGVDRERQYDIDDARTAELRVRRDYIDSLASYLTALDQFKTRLGLPLTEALYLDDRDREALIQAGLIPVEINKDAAFRLCVQRHMEVLNAIDGFEDAKRQVRITADQLRPELSLFSTASVETEKPDDYANFNWDDLKYTAGLRLNLPLDRLQQRNTYRRALVLFERELRSLASTLDTYKDRIDRGLRTLEQRRLTHQIAVESLKVAESQVEATSMLLAAGRKTIRDLREAQDSLVNAQNNLADVYRDYLAARLEFLLNIGVIDTRPEQFWLLDPLKDTLDPGQRGAPPLRMPNDRVLPPETFIEPAS